MHRTPFQKLSKINLGDGTDGVEVSSTAIVFGVIPSQCLINITGTQHQERASCLSASPWKQLGHQISSDHARTRLDVLESQVFRGSPSGGLEMGYLAGGVNKQ